MKDKYNGAARLRADTPECHGRTLRHDGAITRVRNGNALRCLQALSTGHQIPSLGPRMSMCARLHAGLEDRFHISGCVLFTRDSLKR
ncbi:MAG: hypothetical protein JWM63_4875, partial [Gammaproteobacteria bacterium]|nr:hypothetical protein [Gammaproteobacteria bacterium]